MVKLIPAIGLALAAALGLVAVVLADHNGVAHQEPQGGGADVYITQKACGEGIVVINSPGPVAGAQVFLRVPGAMVLEVRPLPPLDDAVLLNRRVLGFVNYAAGNFPSPYGRGFPSGEFDFFSFRFHSAGPVQAGFYQSGWRETIVSDPYGSDVTGKLTGATLYPCEAD